MPLEANPVLKVKLDECAVLGNIREIRDCDEQHRDKIKTDVIDAGLGFFDNNQ